MRLSFSKARRVGEVLLHTLFCIPASLHLFLLGALLLLDVHDLLLELVLRGFINLTRYKMVCKKKMIEKLYLFQTNNQFHHTGLHQLPGLGVAFKPMQLQGSNECQRKHVSVTSHPLLMDVRRHIQFARPCLRA